MTIPITDAGLDLDELERLEKAATPGPFEAETDLPVNRHPRVHASGRLVAVFGNMEIDNEDRWEADAALYVAQRNALPSLVHRLHTAEASNAHLETVIAAREQQLTDEIACSRSLAERLLECGARAEKAEAEVARLIGEKAHLSSALMSLQNNRDAIEASLRQTIADLRSGRMAELPLPELTSDEVLRGALSDCRHDEASIEDTASWIVEALELAGWYISAISAASRPDPAQPGQSSAQPAEEPRVRTGRRSTCTRGATAITATSGSRRLTTRSARCAATATLRSPAAPLTERATMTSEFERGVRAAGNWMRTHAYDIISRHADEMIGETLHYSLESPVAPAGDREAVALVAAQAAYEKSAEQALEHGHRLKPWERLNDGQKRALTEQMVAALDRARAGSEADHG